MTREEKIKWLEEATAEQLLTQYDGASTRMSGVFEQSSLKFDEVQEDWELVRAEMFKRLSKGEDK